MSGTLTIRDAEAGDAHAITTIYAASVAVETASWEATPPDVTEIGRRMAGLRGGGYPWLVAEDEGVLGFAYAGPFRARAAYDWSVEDSVYVAEGARGLGVATALLGALIARCERRGYRQMLAVLGDADGPSRALHAKLGFEERGRLPGFGYKLGAWRDLLLMQRALGEGDTAPPSGH